MINSSNRKKGFTLTEIIVVIAIIGILSAVLITSITGYIEKAKKSNDIQLASQMTNELQNYCIENDIDQKKLCGIDVRTILISKSFKLIPSMSKWTYVYNVNSNKIEIKQFDKKTVLADDNTKSRADITELIPGFYLIGKGNTAIEQAVEQLSLGNYYQFIESDRISSIEKQNSLFDEYVQYVKNNYSYEKVLYVNGAGIVNSYVIPVGSYEKVVFCEHVNYIPSITIDDSKISDSTIVENTNLLFSIAGNGNLQNVLNIPVKNSVEVQKLGSSIVANYNDMASKPNNYEERIELSYPNTNTELDYLTEADILNTNFRLGSNAVSATMINTSFSEVNSSLDLWKMSVLFTDDSSVIGYKEIYFVRTK